MLLPSLALLNACITQPVNPDDTDDVYNRVEVEEDDFKKVLYYKGPVFSHVSGEDTDDPEVEELAINGRKPKASPETYMVRVTDFYQGDWRAFDQAYDRDGNKFHALRISHYVKCPLICGYEEGLDIHLPSDYIKEHAKTGMTFRLYGAYGASAPFTIPPAYIAGFLRAMVR